jgi:phosphoribosylformylglycinamidine cyclo-ligase
LFDKLSYFCYTLLNPCQYLGKYILGRCELPDKDYEAMIGYGMLDPVKRAAMEAARLTDSNIADTGLSVLGWSRGESVFLVEQGDIVWGTLEEGLGTKNKVADAISLSMHHAYMVAKSIGSELGKTFYDQLAMCNAAMIFNDMATLNLRALIANMHWAVGSPDFFKNERRVVDLIDGTKKACDKAGCVWGGGETPTLRNIVYPDSILLSGSAIGWANPKSKLITPKAVPGDSIFVLLSSGIMANGLTMARDVAEMLPHGYFTTLSDGQTYGEALLTPTDIYGPAIGAMIDDGIGIDYAVNITGHGWRKLMRLNAEVSYIVHNLPIPGEEFCLIQTVMRQNNKQMYETFNMGGGFAIYAPSPFRKRIEGIAKEYGFKVIEAGYIEAGPRRVVIEPLQIEWTAKDLGVR